MNKLLTMLLLFCTTSCCAQNNHEERDFVRYVAQPEMEIGKLNDFYINFVKKPDSIQISGVPEGLDFNPSFNRDDIQVGIDRRIYSDDDNEQYHFYAYATPLRAGQIEMPVLTAWYKGKPYQTAPLQINAVDTIMTIGEDDVKVVWSANKKVYHKNDTIILRLYDYSRFSKNQRRSEQFDENNNLSMKGEGNTIGISIKISADNRTGIKGLEQYIMTNFNCVGIHIDFFGENKSMEKFADKLYIKSLIWEMRLLAKTTGTFSIGPSKYNYYLFKSTTDYLHSFVPSYQNNGSYKVTNNGATKLEKTSNILTFTVE